MPAAPLPQNENERLQALHSYRILDTAQEIAFDRVVAVASRVFEMPICLVSLVDENRQWFKACIGLDGKQTSRDDAFCAHAILADEPLIVHDATADARFADNPLVTGAPHIRFYAGAPLRSQSGFKLGTLCLIDTKPRAFDITQRQTLTDLAALVTDELELRSSAHTRRMLERIAEVTPGYIYILDVAERKISYSNRGLDTMLGYPPSDLSDLAVRRKLIHPDDRGIVEDRVARLLNAYGQTAIETTYRLLAANGEYRWFLSREVALERDAEGKVNEIVGVASDITTTKNAQLALQISERELERKLTIMQSVFENVAEGIGVANARGEIVEMNPAGRRITGFGATDALEDTNSHAQYFTQSDGKTPVEAHDLPLSRAIRGEVTDGVEMIVRNAQTAEPVLIQVTGRPLLNHDGEVDGGVVTFRDVTALKAAQRELATLAVTDEMTGLPNLRAFRERLRLLSLESGRGRSFALVMADIDFFKKVNDTHGHAMGDSVLIAVARILHTQVRKTDFVARYGGEEFCLLYTDISEDVATLLAEKLRRAIEIGGTPIPITCSFGVAWHAGTVGESAPPPDPEYLLHDADEALYRAKAEGRNRVCLAHR